MRCLSDDCHEAEHREGEVRRKGTSAEGRGRGIGPQMVIRRKLARSHSIGGAD